VSASGLPAPPEGQEALGRVGGRAQTTGRSVLSGSLWNALSGLLPQLGTLGVSVAAARFLGPAGMGRQSFIAFSMFTLSELLSEGLKASLSRSIAEAWGAGAPGAAGRLLGVARKVTAALALAGGGTLAVAALAGAKPQAAWWLAALDCAITIGQSIPWATLAGTQRWKPLSQVGIASNALAAATTVAVLAAGGGIVGMFAVEAGYAALALIVVRALARRAERKLVGAAPLPGLARRTVRLGLYATAMTFLNFVVWQRSEFFFLRAFATDRQIALYSIAFSTAAGLALVPSALAGVLTPAFATLHGAGERARMRVGYWRALRLLATVSLPLMAAGLTVGPALLRFLYGHHYAHAGALLEVLLIPYPLLPLLVAADAYLSAIGRVGFALGAQTVGALVTIALNLALVPAYKATGAAWADIGGQLVAMVAILIYVARLTDPIELEGRSLGVAALAAALGGLAAAVVLSQLPRPFNLVAGGLAWGTVALVLGVLLGALPRRDRQWLRSALPAGLPRPLERAAQLLIGAPRSAAGPVRIALFTDATAFGGAESVLRTLIGELDGRYKPTVVGVDRQVVARIAAARPDSAQLVVPAVASKWQLRQALRQVRALRALDADILHIALPSPWHGSFALLAGVLSPRTRVVVVENAVVPSAVARQRLLRRALLSRVDAHVTVSADAAGRLERLLGLRPGRIKVIPNGIPIGSPPQPRPALSDSGTIGSLARLTRDKQLDRLVKLLVRLPNVRLRLAGEGPDRARLLMYAEQLGVADRLELLGEVADSVAFLETIDLFVLPTLSESGLPLAVMEAMAAGVPVVTSALPPIVERLAGTPACALVDPADEEELASTVRSLLADPAVRARLAANGRRFVEERCDAREMVSRYTALYDSLLARAPARKGAASARAIRQ